MDGRVLLVAALAVLALAAPACGDDDADGAATTTTEADEPSTSSTSSSSTSTSEGDRASTTVPQGCPSSPGGAPEGATTSEVVDVDGDGRPDTAYLAGSPGEMVVGISTASGATDERPIESASPLPRRLLVVDADERGPVELLVSDGRSVELLAFVDCRVQPVLNVQGDTYTFDLGFRGTGTGVGCIDVVGDSRRELVGLDAEPQPGGVVRWSRTVIELEGLEARNGATDRGTFQEGTDDEAIALLYEVTCGEQTMLDDGIVRGG